MDLTLLGIVMDVRPVQPKNALFPIEVTLLGMVTDVKAVQFSNALSPTAVRPFGMVYDASSLPTGYIIRVVLFLLKSTPLSEL